MLIHPRRGRQREKGAEREHFALCSPESPNDDMAEPSSANSAKSELDSFGQRVPRKHFPILVSLEFSPPRLFLCDENHSFRPWGKFRTWEDKRDPANDIPAP